MSRVFGLLFFCAAMIPPRASCEGDEEAAKLLSDLESFSAQISAMIREASPGASRKVAPTEKRWRFQVGSQSRYERFRLSDPRTTIPDPTDPESVRRALDELNALIDLVKESGIDDPNLDEAESMAKEAELILADPGGNLEEAADLIVVAQALVETAIELFGKTGDSRFIDYDKSVSQDWSQSGFFAADYRRDFEDGSEVRWDTELEGGDRFSSWESDLLWVRPLGDRWKVLARNSNEVRVYWEDLADDVFEEDLDLELQWEPAERLKLEFGGEWDYRTEYDSDPNDGYYALSPRCGLSADWGDWGETGLRYDRSTEQHLDAEDEDFDYDRDRLRAWWERFGERTFMTVSTAVSWKDINREDDQDDYREESAEIYLSYDCTRDVAVGLRSEWTRRRYGTTGSFDAVQNMMTENENTDYDGFLLEPFVELDWTADLTTRLEYRFSGVRNKDRIADDGIDKSLGDYNAHQVAVEIDWRLPRGFDLNIREELEFRGYLHGETGTIETWFADLRNIADCRSNTISAWITCPVAGNTKLEISVFNTFEDYGNFPNLDNDQTTVSVELTYSF
jgi:hypothetical protein